MLFMKSVLLNYSKSVTDKSYFDNVVYDHERNISVYKIEDKCIPLIDSPSVNMGVMTKTEVAREKDDTFPFNLALETKTYSDRESDDQGTYNN